MEIKTDIVIIGSGLAAYAAALELRGSGREVTVVAKAPGASALNSGAWDIADSPIRGRKDEWKDWPSWKEALRQILRREERHPYTLLSRGQSETDFVDFVEKTVARAAAVLPLPMASGDPLALVGDLGTVKPSAWVQASMRDADLRRWDQAKVLVVGIPGFPNFNARFIQQSLLEQQEAQRKTHVKFAGSFDLEIPEWAGRVSMSAIELAQRLDREEVFVSFGQEIVRYLEGKVYTHLLLPPIMGLENTPAILQALNRITGLTAAETLATPMSVPGWRLQQALENFFHENHCERLEGEAVGFDADGRRVKALYVHRGDQRLKLKAGAFLLATGKYLGGGIQRRGRWKEPLFNLPIFLDGRVLDSQSLPQTSRPHVAERQPFLSCGVTVNSLGQALDVEGQIVFDNLFAAGAILGEFSPAQDRCAAGVSLVSGTIAGRHASAVG
ncbi:MAG: FAD-binding protein [Deltaproteobacteria bacterium]|nr:FAD-binding protein [Deltaproteobacteria bacterium]